jgi:glycosyltransferase involved in cell wall biosynthesis
MPVKELIKDRNRTMNVSAQPLVSVVTPVYNGGKYLAECIESVLAQTYQNWEYLIVNNCSTDRTLEIAQNYANKDKRIHIHNNKDFLNALQNHNHALRLISPDSKYCKIVHADDFIFPECLIKMVEVAESSQSVGIVGSYMLCNNKVRLDRLPYPGAIISGREICRMTILAGPNVFGSPTSLLIRSDLIRNSETFYNESHIYADHEACYAVLQHSDFGFVHQVLTYSRVHNERRTSFANNFNTYISAKVHMTVKYGPLFLNKEDCDQRLNELMKDYYRFLARSLFLLREKEFWEYHKKELNETGYPLNSLKLMKAFFFEFFDIVLNPKKAVEEIINKLNGLKKVS